MTNEHEAAVEKAYESWSETYCIRLTKKGKADFGKHIQVYLDETKLREKLKIAEEALDNTVTAWESLKGGQRYTGAVLEEWLADSMSPAIDAIRNLRGENA